MSDWHITAQQPDPSREEVTCARIAAPGGSCVYHRKRSVVVEIDAYAVEALAQLAYGADDYSFVATEECGNDSIHRFVVTGEVERWKGDEVDEFRQNGKGRVHNDILLNMLCEDGLLEPATYLVEVCW